MRESGYGALLDNDALVVHSTRKQLELIGDTNAAKGMSTDGPVQVILLRESIGFGDEQKRLMMNMLSQRFYANFVVPRRTRYVDPDAHARTVREYQAVFVI